MRRLILPLVILAIFAACTPAALSTPARETPTAEPSPSISSTPGPEADLHVDEVAVLPGDEVAQWQVVTVISNQGLLPLTGIELEISIFNAEDSLLGMQTYPLEDRVLQPGEGAALLTDFTASADTIHAVIRPLQAEPAESDTPSQIVPAVMNLETIATPPDQHYVVGMLSNDSGSTLLVQEFLLLARDPQGSIIAARDGYIGLHALAPNEETYLLTAVPALPADSTFETYLHAIEWEEDTDTPLVFLEDSRLRFDAQGHAFITAYLHNEGEAVHWAEIVVTVSSDGTALALGHVRLPAPIPPGETRAVILQNLLPLQEEFPLSELSERPTTMDVRLDAAGSQQADHYPRPLRVALSYYDRIGSVLIVRGTITNTWDLTLFHPSVLIALRSTEGNLLTGNWSVLAPSIEADTTVDFQLTIPLPAGINPAMSEYDLLAFGLLP